MSFFIHTLEVLIVFLALIKVLQVKALYLRSLPTRHTRTSNIIATDKVETTPKKQTFQNDPCSIEKNIERNKEKNKDSNQTSTIKNLVQPLFENNKPDYSGLPLPEVSYTNTQQADTISTNLGQTNSSQTLIKEDTTKTELLSGYIDGFFKIPTQAMSQKTELSQKPALSEKTSINTQTLDESMQSSNDDEFIRVTHTQLHLVKDTIKSQQFPMGKQV